jgi:hypothetical protein
MIGVPCERQAATAVEPDHTRRRDMRYLILWLLGVPASVLLLLWFFKIL